MLKLELELERKSWWHKHDINMPPRRCSSQLCCYLLVFHPGSDILSLLRSGNILNHHCTAEISHESSGCGQCLLEYLLERLQVESCHVKLKVRTVLLFKFLSVMWNCEMEWCPVAIMNKVLNVSDLSSLSCLWVTQGSSSCFWCFRCWRSLSIFAVMAQTISSQSLEGTPPSSSKRQVRHWSLVAPFNSHHSVAAPSPEYSLGVGCSAF